MCIYLVSVGVKANCGRSDAFRKLGIILTFLKLMKPSPTLSEGRVMILKNYHFFMRLKF